MEIKISLGECASDGAADDKSGRAFDAANREVAVVAFNLIFSHFIVDEGERNLGVSPLLAKQCSVVRTFML